MSKTATKQNAAAEEPVLDFLARLATEPEMMTAFLRDPEVVMKERGLDDKARGALTSGDPMRVYRSISPTALADEQAAEQSMTRAKEVVSILSSDPAVAEWLQQHYFNAFMTWLASNTGAVQTLAAPAQVQSDETPQQTSAANE